MNSNWFTRMVVNFSRRLADYSFSRESEFSLGMLNLDKLEQPIFLRSTQVKATSALTAG